MKKAIKTTFIILLWTMTNLVYSANPYNLSSESYTTTKLWGAAHTSSMNLKPWNSQVTSFKGNSYIVYVDPDLRPKVVKVDSNGSQEAFLDLSDYAALGDPHHQFSIGVDEKGYIHITGDMHNYPAANTYHMPARYQSGNIMYWRSDNPEDISAFTWMGGTAGKCPYGYGNSYCSFFNDHEGHLFHIGRCWATFSYMGGKKDCASMSRYDAETGNWEEIGGLPGVNNITMNTLFWEDNAEGGTSSYARVRPWGVADMDNRLHLVCNLLNNNDYPVGGHINTDCVYIRSTDGADSFTKADGSAVPLPARVEAGSHQGDVLLSYDYLSSDNAVAVDQNLNPHVLIKNKSGQNTILSYDTASGWTDHGWANCTTVAGTERIYHDAMGVMTISKYGYLYRFWNWDEATNHRADVGRVYSDIDRCHLQNMGNIQGLSTDGDQLALFRTTITRPQPEIEVECLGIVITNRDDTPSIADHTDWGNVDLGSVYTNTYTLRNTGNAPLRLYTVRTTHPDFSIIEQPQSTVDASTQASFKIEYRPSSHGTSSCVVSFGNSDLNDSRFMFTLAADCTGGSLPPTALTDTYTVVMDAPLQVAAPGVLDNDINPNSLPMTAVKVSDPQHGSIVFAADGSFVYSPVKGYIGPDTFSYKAHSGTHDSTVATVNLDIITNVIVVALSADVVNSSASGFGGSVLNTVNDLFEYDPENPKAKLPVQAWSGSAGFHGSMPEGNDVVLAYSLTDGALRLSAGEIFSVDLYGRNMLNDRCQDIDIKLYSGGFSGTLITTVAGVAIPEISPYHVRAELTPTAAFDTLVVIGHDTTAASGNTFTLMEIRTTYENLSAQDSDEDGLTNAEELVLGTNPDDPDSTFKITEHIPLPTSGRFQISWPSATGVLYRASQSPNLTDWTVVRDWAAAATPPEDSLEITLTPSNVFFKVEAQIQ